MQLTIKKERRKEPVIDIEENNQKEGKRSITLEISLCRFDSLLAPVVKVGTLEELMLPTTPNVFSFCLFVFPFCLAWVFSFAFQSSPYTCTNGK